MAFSPFFFFFFFFFFSNVAIPTVYINEYLQAQRAFFLSDLTSFVRNVQSYEMRYRFLKFDHA